MTAGGRDGMIFIDPEILNITSDSAYKGQDNIYAIANTVNVKPVSYTHLTLPTSDLV